MWVRAHADNYGMCYLISSLLFLVPNPGLANLNADILKI